MVVWTSIAEQHYNSILVYLFEKWNLKIVNNFIIEVEKAMNLIETNPFCFEEFSLNKNYRKGFIHKNVSFFTEFMKMKLLFIFFGITFKTQIS
jgi:hypothetical protein